MAREGQAAEEVARTIMVQQVLLELRTLLVELELVEELVVIHQEQTEETLLHFL